MFIFALGLAWPFIAFELLAFIALIYFTEKEYFPLALAEYFLVIPAILYFVFDINVLSFTIANLGWLSVGALAYFVIGSLWSMLKWYQYTHSIEMKELIENRWLEYKKKYNDDIVEHFKANSYYNPLYRPNNYSLSNALNWKIANWIFSWPSSMVWTLTRELTVNLARNIMSLLGGVFDRIAKNTYDNLK